MDEVLSEKKEVQSIVWTEKIKECQESGLSVQEWCRQNGINAKTYYYHSRKIREKAIEQIPIPISATTQLSEKLEIKINIGNAVVQIPDGMSEQTITAVMRALKQ